MHCILQLCHSLRKKYSFCCFHLYRAWARLQVANVHLPPINCIPKFCVLKCRFWYHTKNKS